MGSVIPRPRENLEELSIEHQPSPSNDKGFLTTFQPYTDHLCHVECIDVDTPHSPERS